MPRISDVLSPQQLQWVRGNLGNQGVNATLERIRAGRPDALQFVDARLQKARSRGQNQIVQKMQQVRSAIMSALTGGSSPVMPGNGGGRTVDDVTGTPTAPPETKGIFDWIGDNIVDPIGDFFGGGGPGAPGGPLPPGFLPPGFGQPGSGQPPSGDPGSGGQMIAGTLIPPGIWNIISNVNDVAELLRNPSAAAFWNTLDPTTQNSIANALGLTDSTNGNGNGMPSPPTPPDTGQPPAPGGGGMNGGSIQGSLMMELLADSISSKAGKATMQAMMSGSLQRGIWFPAQPVQTPRGTHYFSPPGYVTVDVSDQKVSVFRPIAKKVFGYKSGSPSDLQKLDKLARKFGKARRDVKKLAPKVGLKTKNRKSGPTR